VPANVPIGKYRRIIQPFEDWTLVCDENLKAMRRVCNVTQSVVDQRGGLVFSWSLAATTQGVPIVIVRTPASVGKGTAVSLTPAGAKQPREMSPFRRAQHASLSTFPSKGFRPQWRRSNKVAMP
jgi:hypothetical protein